MRYRLTGLFLALTFQGCASLEISSWEYRQPGQPSAVRAAASIGETVGFVAFMPVSLALFPILLPIVHIFDVGDPYTLLFLPSIKAGEVGSVALGGLVSGAIAPFRGSGKEAPPEAISSEERAPPGATSPSPSRGRRRRRNP